MPPRSAPKTPKAKTPKTPKAKTPKAKKPAKKETDRASDRTSSGPSELSPWKLVRFPKGFKQPADPGTYRKPATYMTWAAKKLWKLNENKLNSRGEGSVIIGLARKKRGGTTTIRWHKVTKTRLATPRTFQKDGKTLQSLFQYTHESVKDVKESDFEEFKKKK